MPPLGTLEKVNLRDIWPNEASDFTPWLAQEENLNSSLFDAIQEITQTRIQPPKSTPSGSQKALLTSST